MCAYSERAADAHNTLDWVLLAAADQPRILASCAAHADLGFLADGIAAKVLATRTLLAELEAVAAVISPAAIRRAA